MIFYNGTTGSLGRYFADAAKAARLSVTPLKSRLEETNPLRSEFSTMSGESATLIHFAAKVSVPWCEANPETTYQTNVVDTTEASRVFIQTARERKVRPNLIYVSSAHLYAKNEGKIHETDPVLPRSVYARTKLEAEVALGKLAQTEGVDLRIARVFGLVAPEQPEFYVLHAMLKRARERRLADVPGLSNLRDYLDSRDVCRALAHVSEVSHDQFSRVCPDRILNVASGEGISIRDLLTACLRALYPEEVATLLKEVSEAPPRADDVPRIIGSVERYRSLFGENPRSILIEQTIQDALVLRA